MGTSDFQSTLSHTVALLSPLQDPVKNWEVDLAAHLEVFLKQLYRLTTERPDGNYKINFVEAAVLIQRSAGIYSKKVEYLMDILMDVLHSFQVKSKPNTKSSSTRRKTVGVSIEGETNTADTWEAIEDLSFDDQKWKHQPNNFKFEPFIICELEQRIPSKLDIELCDRNMDKLGKKSDFRLNSLISSTCMLEDDFTVQTTPAGILFGVQTVQLQPGENNGPRLSPVHQMEDMDVDNDHLESHDGGDFACPSPELDGCENEFPAARHSTVAGSREEVVTVDPWKADKIKEFATKALNAKVNYKIPPCDVEVEKTDRKRKLRERQKERDIKLMANFLTSDMIKAGFSKKAIDSIPRFTVELIEEFKRHKKKLEQKRRAEEIENLRIQLATDFSGDFIGFEDYEYSSGEEDGFLGYDDGLPEDDDNNNEDNEGLANNDDFPAPQVIDPSTLDSNHTRESYQAVLQEKLNEYFSMGEQLIQSDLSKRVNQWHESIRPVLEAAEKRGHFDIHEYGTRVLDCFPKGNRKTTIPFAKVVDGKPKEDVSRYFLSSLMLANSYNVEISKSDTSELAMDCMELTLLKSTRHHEDLQDYEAPSQLSRRS